MKAEILDRRQGRRLTDTDAAKQEGNDRDVEDLDGNEITKATDEPMT